MKYYAWIGDREYECTLDAGGGGLFVTLEGERYGVDLTHVAQSHAYSLLLGGRSYEFTLLAGEDEVELSGAAGLFHIRVEDARTHAARSKTASARGPAAGHIVKAAMPGIVREVLVDEGNVVARGDPLLILEAMKMQNEIRADRAGTVQALHVAAGDTVDKGAKLVGLE